MRRYVRKRHVYVFELQYYITGVRRCQIDACVVTIPYHAERKRHIDASGVTIPYYAVRKRQIDAGGVTILYHWSKKELS